MEVAARESVAEHKRHMMGQPHHTQEAQALGDDLGTSTGRQRVGRSIPDLKTSLCAGAGVGTSAADRVCAACQRARLATKKAATKPLAPDAEQSFFAQSLLRRRAAAPPAGAYGASKAFPVFHARSLRRLQAECVHTCTSTTHIIGAPRLVAPLRKRLPQKSADCRLLARLAPLDRAR